MIPRLSHSRALVLAALLLSIAPVAGAQRSAITTPKQQLGHEIGEDYFLANYTQLIAYWQKLAKESDRMKLVSIGKTAEGRDQYMAIISAPENIKKLEEYRRISRRLTLAKG